MKAWLLRPMPHNIPRMKEFRDNSIIAIGWPEIGSLTGKNKQEIHECLKDHPLNYAPQELGIATSTVNSFVNEMRQGDLVVVPYGNDVFFAEISSDYLFEPSKIAEGYPHQRNVKWIRGPVRRNEIFEDLRKSLRAPRTLADLSHHAENISRFVSNNLPLSNSATDNLEETYIEFEYPVRLETFATIRIPKDITQAEASRLGDFVKTLFFS